MSYMGEYLRLAGCPRRFLCVPT